ncbi:helix-turn-helix domain-containing protein [Terrimonas sp. NA20]|uniref:Helix-turn-helix domain-containing protein n=1 Tax=Terrimonas ginsenosidimutans TaxID=2908004 RepID=A0ABS9KKV4_9BACT|nr:helix-turn-helix domain-containing protein [Terrimonas ginsenosidimutans]MCG2612948.1 helix-turn-helix domain-containing protein [Terrimonas ginsenosidimutans]
MIEIFHDIRRLYKFRQPCPELESLVEFYSETSDEHSRHCIGDQPFTVKLFPSYTPTIWINLGAPYHLRNGSDLHFISADQDILLLRDRIVERQNLPSDNIFTVKFNPGALEIIMGVEQRKLVNDVFDANGIIPAELLTRMKKQDSFEQRYQLLESFLLDRFVRNKTETSLLSPVTQAVTSFINSGMKLQTEELAQQLFVSSRTFNRYFHAVTGTNPKSFLASIRARTALTAYKQNRTSFSVYDFGYFDPGHFYKDAFRFTGMKLSAIH